MPVKESSGIHSMFLENHRNLNQNLAGLTSLFSEKITTSTATTIMTTTTTTTNSPPYHGYSLQCNMCGQAFVTVEDIKNHFVEQHKADAIAIHSSSSKF